MSGLLAKAGLQFVLALLVAPLLSGIIKTLKAQTADTPRAWHPAILP